MSKIAFFLLLINIIIVVYKVKSIYSNERKFFASIFRFCGTKFGITTINSCILLLLYNLLNFGILLFFGGLRPFENEKIREKIWFAVTDTFLAFAVFSGEMSSNVVLSLALLLFLKYFHFVFEVRVGSIERDTNIPLKTIVKNSSFFFIFFIIDLFFAKYLFSYGDAGDSIQQLLVNEYAILSVNLFYNMAKLIIHYIDFLKNYSFNEKNTIFSYLFIAKCLLETLIHIFYLVVTIFRHGVLPILFVRPLMASMSGFVNAVKVQINCNKVVNYINKISPDATNDELQTTHDNTCVVCREEMTSAKKLPCGHLFHFECLKSWFQRQQTCPTCRMDILSAINLAINIPAPQEINITETHEEPLIQDPYSQPIKGCSCSSCVDYIDFKGDLNPENKKIMEELGIDTNDQNLDLNRILKNIEANQKSTMNHINLLKKILQNKENKPEIKSSIK